MGGAIGGLFGGGQSQPTQPNVQVYQPTGTSSVDQQLQNLIGQGYNNVYGASNPYSTLNPQFLTTFDSLYGSPYASGYQTAAGNAGNAYTNTGNQAGGASSQLNNAALNLIPGAQQVANLGLDPQSALYNQLLQQTTDQANVANAQYGLTGQQAAGNLNQDLSNFNINWQNNQLQRAISGLQGASGALSNVGATANTANNLGTSGAGSLATGGATPYTVGQGIGGGQETALMQYLTQLLGPTTAANMVIPSAQNYLNTGVSASEGGANAGLQDYYAQLQGQEDLGAGIGGLLGLGTGGGNTLGGDAFASIGSFLGF